MENYLHIRTPREVSNKKIAKFKLFEAIFGKKNMKEKYPFLKALYCL